MARPNSTYRAARRNARWKRAEQHKRKLEHRAKKQQEKALDELVRLGQEMELYVS